jgi:hypothetical protein
VKYSETDKTVPYDVWSLTTQVGICLGEYTERKYRG